MYTNPAVLLHSSQPFLLEFPLEYMYIQLMQFGLDFQ